MSDVQSAEAEAVQASADAPVTKLMISITKGKAAVEIDTSLLPDNVYQEVLIQGLKVLLNRGMSKITTASTKDDNELKAQAMTKAEENVAAVYSGDIKFTGGAKTSKVSGAVKTEAMRLARNLVKDEMKRQKIKIAHVEALEITKAAKALLDSDPSLLAQAEANLKAREVVPVASSIIAGIAISTTKVAKAEAKKAKAAADKPLSAKQAGMVVTKAKPKGGAGATQH